MVPKQSKSSRSKASTISTPNTTNKSSCSGSIPPHPRSDHGQHQSEIRSHTSNATAIRASMNDLQHGGQAASQQMPPYLPSYAQHYQGRYQSQPQSSDWPRDAYDNVSSEDVVMETARRVPMSVVGNGNSIAARRGMVPTSGDGIKIHLQHNNIPMNAQQMYSPYFQSYPQPQSQAPHSLDQRQHPMQRSSSHQGIPGAPNPSSPMIGAQSSFSASHHSPHLVSQAPYNGSSPVPMDLCASSNDCCSPQPGMTSALSSGNAKSKVTAKAKSAEPSRKGSRSASTASGSRGGSAHRDDDDGLDSPRRSRSRSKSRAPSETKAPPTGSLPLGTIADMDAVDNRLGPCPSEYKCPYCEKIYTGNHARSVWRRHLQSKHKIPFSEQPKRSRWDAKIDRPRSKVEKRDRALASKRKWAKRDRMLKKHGKVKGAEMWEAEANMTAEGAVPREDLEEDGEDDEDHQGYSSNQNANRANALGLGLFEEAHQQSPSCAHHSEGSRSHPMNPYPVESGQQRPLQLDVHPNFTPRSKLPASAPGGRTLTLNSSPRRTASVQGRSASVSPSQGHHQPRATRSADWLSGVAFASSPDPRAQHPGDCNNYLPAALAVSIGYHYAPSALPQSINHYGSFGSSTPRGTASNLPVYSADMERSRSDLGPTNGNTLDYNSQFYSRRCSGSSEGQAFPSMAHSNLARASMDLARSSTLPIPPLPPQPLIVGAPGSSSNTIIPNKTPVTHYSDLYPTPPSMGNASSSGQPSKTFAHPVASPSGDFEEEHQLDRHSANVHQKRTGFGMGLGGQMRRLSWQASAQEIQKSQQNTSLHAPPSLDSRDASMESGSFRQPLLISPNKDKSDRMLSLSQLPPRSTTSIPISNSQTHLGNPNAMDVSSTGSLEFNQFFSSTSYHSDVPPPAGLAQASVSTDSIGAPSAAKVSQASQLCSAFVPTASSLCPARHISGQAVSSASQGEAERPSPSSSHPASGPRRFNPEESPLARRLKSTERLFDQPESGHRLVRFSPSSHIPSTSLSSRPNSDWCPSSASTLSLATTSLSTLMGSTPKRKANPFSLEHHRISPPSTGRKATTANAGEAKILAPMLGLTPVRPISAASKRGRGDADGIEKEAEGLSPLAEKALSLNHQNDSVGSKSRSVQSTRNDDETANSPEESDRRSSTGKTPSRHHQTLFSSPANLGLTSSLGLAPGSDFKFASTPGRRAFEDSFGEIGYTPSALSTRMQGGSSSLLLGMGFTPFGNEKKSSPKSVDRTDGLGSSFSQFIPAESPLTSSLLSRSSSHAKDSFDSPTSFRWSKVSGQAKGPGMDGQSALKKLDYGRSKVKSIGQSGEDGEEMIADMATGSPRRSRSRSSSKKMVMVR